ncbi:MAG: hypothetical protein OEZ59_02480 [Deltaproteobacteria bacterium]|nr:hypothetical protein [Deltaproteobacteria bacterium]
MSMDPSKWIPFEKLSEPTRERITTIYPYLKVEHCVFQDKESGVFMKQTNNVKIEKLLDPPRKNQPAVATAAAAAATTTTTTAPPARGRTRKG